MDTIWILVGLAVHAIIFWLWVFFVYMRDDKKNDNDKWFGL